MTTGSELVKTAVFVVKRDVLPPIVDDLKKEIQELKEMMKALMEEKKAVKATDGLPTVVKGSILCYPVELPLSKKILYVHNVNGSVLTNVAFEEVNPFVKRKTSRFQKRVNVKLSFSNGSIYTGYETSIHTTDGKAHRLDQPFWDTESGNTQFRYDDDEARFKRMEDEDTEYSYWETTDLNFCHFKKPGFSHLLEINDVYGADWEGSDIE